MKRLGFVQAKLVKGLGKRVDVLKLEEILQAEFQKQFKDLNSKIAAN